LLFCLYFSLLNITKPITEKRNSFTHSKYSVSLNQITRLVLYYVRSRFVVLKFIEAPTESADYFITFCFKLIYFAFKIFPVFVLNHLLASHLTLFRLSSLFWFGICNHCILAWFLGDKICEHSSCWEFYTVFKIFPSCVYVLAIV
jgi:hypothetical protein